ncbi:autotransporter-associated beta strand repeat-containing protein, partial [Variovorax sp. WDL1]|uniref:autotransporter-associated beta strand repeat-containing protein n=1 Tax=Variovorax sp. WDL1 TaxID=207745 RepID=UPI000838424E
FKYGGGGGGGGAGGGGLLITGAANVTNNGTVSGGKGGDGGVAYSDGGAGGGGGMGAALTGGGSLLNNNTGGISGGAGGAGGGSHYGTTGPKGAGGIGVVATGGASITNNGTISGGLSADGVTRAAAVFLSGGGNTLTLQSDFAFNGNVISQGNDKLVLDVKRGSVGGSTSSPSFNVSNIVKTLPATYSGTQYVGFRDLAKTGAGTWVLTGTGTDDVKWSIVGGTLQGDANTFKTGITFAPASAADTPRVVFNQDSGNVNSTTAAIYSFRINGAGSVVKIGDGKLTLTEGQDYSGTTTITSGTLALSGNGNIQKSSRVTSNGVFDISGTGGGTTISSLAGTGSVVLGNGMLTLSNAADVFSGVIGGTGGVSVNGGIQTLSGANIYTGDTSIHSGATLALGSAGSISTSRGLRNDGIFDISGSSGATVSTLGGNGNVLLGGQTLALSKASGTFDGIISGAGGLTVAGGTQSLTAVNTYDGVTTIASNAKLALRSASSIASSSGVASDGVFDISNITTTGTTIRSLAGGGSVVLGSRALTLSNADATGTFGGIVSGTGSVALTGGTQMLQGINTYTGTTTVGSGATLALGGAGSIASSSGLTNNGVLDISGTGSGATLSRLGGTGKVLLGNRTLTLSKANDDFSGVISGSGGIALAGGAQKLSGVNTYAGTTTIASGAKLSLGSEGSISSSRGLVDDGVFDISGTNGATITSLAGGGSVVLGGRTLTLSSADDTFSGVISGSGGIAVTGGIQMLSGPNGYTGATTVEVDTTLALGGAGSIASSSALVNQGAFDITGTTSGATVTSLIGTGTVDLGARTLTLSNPSGTFGGVIHGDGAVTIKGGRAVFTGQNVYRGGTNIIAGSLAGSATSFGSGPIANNAALLIEQPHDATLANTITGSGVVTKTGTAMLTLTGENSYSGGTDLKEGGIAVGNNSALGSGELAMHPDTTLRFAADGLTLANPIAFTDALDPTIDTGPFTATLTGAITGPGDLSKIGSGTLIVSGANSYAGATAVTEGTLRAGAANTFSAASAHSVAPGATLDLAGFSQGIASLINAGTVSLIGAAPGTTLTVTGPYVGNNGLLRLGAFLGDSASASDRLILSGPAAVADGSTTVQVVNLGGLGALTTGNGIELVSALNGATTTAQSTKDAFSLQGGHVDAGAYEYRLQPGDATGAGENWYLRSTSTIIPPPPAP